MPGAGSLSLYSWGDEIFLKNAAYRERLGAKLIGQFQIVGVFDMHAMYGNGPVTGTVIILQNLKRSRRTGNWDKPGFKGWILGNLPTNLRSAGRIIYLPILVPPQLAFESATKRFSKVLVVAKPKSNWGHKFSVPALPTELFRRITKRL